MTWRAHAHPNDFGRVVDLRIMLDRGAHSADVLTELNANGGTVVHVEGLEEGAEPDIAPIKIPVFAAQEIYNALHRLYGQEADSGTREALKIERARVDKALDMWLKKGSA